MTLFFNLKTLEEESCNDVNKFMWILWYHYSKKVPSLRAKYKPAKLSLAGTSFLLAPQSLFEDKSTDIMYKVQYVRLAGLRDYSLYKQYKYRSLMTSYFPDLKYESIKHNPLLTITPTDISFKYEKE